MSHRDRWIDEDALQYLLRDLICLATVADHVRWVLVDDPELRTWLAGAAGEWRGWAEQAAAQLAKSEIAPDGRIRIPLNEEASRTTGQIEEFLMKFNGEGIQHIALLTDDLLHTLDRLRDGGVPLMTPPPATYYEMLDERLPGHGENVSDLRARGVLVDGTTEGGGRRLLLQIFSEALFGPVFFEFIERKGDQGFGEGNFKALFESMELDQMRRGVLQK